MDFNEEININIDIVGDINTPLSSMVRPTRQKINKETAPLNITPDWMDLIDSYRTLYPKAAGYTFFSIAHGIFSKIDQMS